MPPWRSEEEPRTPEAGAQLPGLSQELHGIPRLWHLLPSPHLYLDFREEQLCAPG